VPAHLLVSILAALVLVVTFPSAASAAKCGTIDPKTNAVVKAKLEIDPDSVTTIAFLRDTDPQWLLVRFKATGCELPIGHKPTIDLLPKQNAKNIPEKAVLLTTARPAGGEYTLKLLADPGELDPGAYEGFLEIRATNINTTRTPISLSRSEDNELVPITIGLIGGLASVIWFLGLHFAQGAKSPRPMHYVLAFVAAALFGAFAVETAYRSQEVWTLSENYSSAAVAAFTGATTGTMLAALAVLFPKPKPKAGEKGNDDGL
jgi:hypothetical protein